MRKALLYRLFGTGRVPVRSRSRVDSEGVILEDEGIGASITLRKFRAPGRRYYWRRNWFVGSIVMTARNFLAFRFSTPVIDVPWDDDRLGCLHCRVEGDAELRIEFDAAAFDADCSGKIELRFRTGLAREFLRVFEQGERTRVGRR